MERELRQLYRQRGSALRRIEQVVVIRDSQDEVRDNMDSSGLIQQIGHTGVVVRGALPNSGHEDIGVVNNGEYLSMPDIVQDSIRNDTNITGYIRQEEEENEGNEEGNETYDNDGDYEVQSEDKDEIGKTYSFEGMPLTKLSTSITSMAAIEVIMGLVTDVFGKHLASQSEENFRQSETRRERLSYKMDLKLFEKFAELLRTDLQDILDIHLSNNDMCYHMKQILRLKQDLTQEIVSVREQLLQHNNGKSKEAEKLRELETLVDLNNKLKSLNQ